MNFKWFTKQCVILTWMFQGFTSSTSFKPSTPQQTCSVIFSSVTQHDWHRPLEGQDWIILLPWWSWLFTLWWLWLSDVWPPKAKHIPSKLSYLFKKKSKCLKPHVKSSGDCEKASEEDLVTKCNCATVIEDKLVRGGVETHPGPGPSNLVSTF